MTPLVLSPLPHTWLIDVDGTIVRHNGHKAGGDELLAGVVEFWAGIPASDVVILLTARAEEDLEGLLGLMRQHGLRFDRVLAGLPAGERILLNDRKPSGLATAFAINVDRDAGLLGHTVSVDPTR